MPHHDHDVDGGSRRFAVLSVTSSRSRDEDATGPLAEGLLRQGGHDVAAVDVVPDDRDAIREGVTAHLGDVDAVVAAGGTGLTPDDVTVEAVEPLFDKPIPGFGEHLRRRSVEEVGTAALLTRATAGVVDGDAVFAVPGRPAAVELALNEIVLPEIDHVLHLARRSQ